MRISLDLELEDKPGQLLKALEPMAELGANVISIIHIREKEKVRSGRIPVHLVVEAEREAIERIARELRNRGIRVIKIGEAEKSMLRVLIIGHVVDTDLRDTIDRINALEGVVVRDMDLSMPHPEKESAALFNIEISAQGKLHQVLERLEEIAREKNLEIVRSLEV